MEITPKLLALLDTLFLLFSVAVAFCAIVGFAVYEPGLIRAKNTSALITKKIGVVAFSALLFLAIGYRLMFATDTEGAAVLPFMDQAWTWRLWVHSPAKGETVAHFYSNFVFQWLFAALNVMIVAGAVAERIRLFSFLFFTFAMTGFIYPIIGHWVWNTGFLYRAGFSDFAGASVVHLSAACACLSGLLLIGPRLGKYSITGKTLSIRGANLPLAAMGALMIWIGFFGLNCGAQLSFSHLKDADNVASVFASTLMAGSGGVLAAMLFSRIFFTRVDMTFILNGLLSSLVAISANPVLTHIDEAALLGASAALVSLVLIMILDRLRLDDPVGAIAVHGGGAIVGLMSIPLFESDASFVTQFYGILAIAGFTFVSTFVVWWCIKILIGLRISEQDEISGLDVADCGLEAYPEFIKTR